MTLAQIEELLPNGFHDAEVEQLIWNFQHGTAVFDMDFWIGSLEGPDREKRRRGRIELQSVTFLAMEPPEPRLYDPKPYRPSGTLQIDAGPPDNIPDNLLKLKRELPPDAEIFSFYVENWNSYIHVSAADARLTWNEH